MGSGKARPITPKAEKPWSPREEPPTEFGRWFRDSELPVSRIMDELGCAKGYAYELLSGAKTPSLENAVKLIQMVEGYDRGCIWAGSFIP